MHDAGLAAMTLLLALGLPIVLIARRLGVSALVAYLIAGAIASGLSLATADEIHALAETGASLLLFTLGLEMDLPDMRKRLRQIVIAAVGQLGSTIVGGALVMRLLGVDWATAFAIGMCLGLSSTLMVLRALEERRLRHRDEGRTVLGLLLAQDICIAPLLVIIAILFPGQSGTPIWLPLVGGVGVIMAVILLRRVFASKVIARIQAAQMPELEVAFAVVVALGSALLADELGLGAAVGAFAAGLAMGGDEHSHGIEVATRPLQGLLGIVFFISIGLQFDLNFVMSNLPLVLGALAVSVLLKAALAGLALRLAGLSLRSAIGAGIMVGQVGEFSFVLATAVARSGGLDAVTYNLIISVAVLSLALTPFLIAIATRLLPRSSLESVRDRGSAIVVAGLGPVGNSVVEAVHAAGLPLLLVDRNQRLLDPWQNVEDVIAHQGRIEDMEDWMPILGTRPRAVVLSFPIADTSALVAERLKSMDPELLIVARSPFRAQVSGLRAAGVTHVICDEDAATEQLKPILAEALDIRRRTEMSTRVEAPS